LVPAASAHATGVGGRGHRGDRCGLLAAVAFPECSGLRPPAALAVEVGEKQAARLDVKGRYRRSPPAHAGEHLPLPGKLHVSIGFGYGSKAESKHILGQCWARRASADGVNHIFLGPQEGDPAGMLISLLHELIHAADDCASGHKGTFAGAATRLGFEGPMTQTPPGLELSSPPKSSPWPRRSARSRTPSSTRQWRTCPCRSRPLAVPRPPPAAARSTPARASREPGMIKLTAAACCGYTVRTTRKWLDQGYPLCPHGQPMHED
jgi:hypothetical protein